MSSNAQLNIARGFQRADPSTVNGHPLRGTFREKVQREHLLRRADNDPRRERIVMIRDTVIAGLGVISALVPLLIAFQSVTGA